MAAAIATTVPGVPKVSDDIKVTEEFKVIVDAKVSDGIKAFDAKSPAETTKAFDVTEIAGAAIISGAASLVGAVTDSPKRDVIANSKAETLTFLEQEYTFSSSELASKAIKKERVSECLINQIFNICIN